MRNLKKEDDITFVKTLTKTVSGAFINNLEVPTYDLPGIFGSKIVELMPTNIREAHIDQKNNIDFGYVCDHRQS